MRLTVRDIIAKMQADSKAPANSVDMLEIGDPEAEVTAIAVSFKATQAVIEQSASLGANLIVAHENTFYSHFIDKNEDGMSTVARAKRQSAIELGIAIYRNHDQIHQEQPDGIMRGLLQKLQWDACVEEEMAAAAVVVLPGQTLSGLTAAIKQALGAPYLRVVGSPDTVCRRVGVLVGYRGGGSLAIPLMENGDLDLLVVGEGPEWETPEYVRDAVRQGRNKALVVLGHAESEDAGVERLAARLQAMFPLIPVHFVASAPVFRIE